MPESKVLELFGRSIRAKSDWQAILKRQWCPFDDRKCFKVRKSQPNLSIGTCTVRHGEDAKDVIICPKRLLERKQVFTDCVHLLTLHEPGNELHVVQEVSIPGGSVDYFLVSARDGKARDFVAIEFQTLDTTGTLWPERQRAVKSFGLPVKASEVTSKKPFGMNWRMTAKTTLVQLHHKIQTLEHVGKHLVLVLQNHLLAYLQAEFNFGHMAAARVGDSMHFHAYKAAPQKSGFKIELESRVSTDADGIAKCLGLQAEARIELAVIVAELEKKLSAGTMLSLASPIAPPR